MIQYVKNFFAIGIGGERHNVCECNQDGMVSWTRLTIKIFLGPWVINFHIDGFKKNMILEE